MTVALSWLIIACIAIAYGLWCYRTGFDRGVAETRKMMREYVERRNE